jgi:hypothetical protein
MAEDRVRHVLTDERLWEIKSMLEKNRAIDCVLLFYLNKGRWKEAKEFMKSINRPMDDATFRARMIELQTLGLSERSERLKKYYVRTKFKEVLGELILEFLEKLRDNIY